jgi:hypothetical protein
MPAAWENSRLRVLNAACGLALRRPEVALSTPGCYGNELGARRTLFPDKMKEQGFAAAGTIHPGQVPAS